jgi:hypothetical protein
MSIIIDAMDAKKCDIPHLHLHPKKWEGLKERKIGSQFVGVINHGVGTSLYMFDDELGKDGDLSDSLVWHTIVEEFKRRDALGLPNPQVLYLQGDNAKDNKNAPLFMLAELLVRERIFMKVKFSFLPVGHTHEDIDACFGAGSHMLHRSSAFTIEEVFQLWRRGWPSTKSFQYISVRLTS